MAYPKTPDFEALIRKLSLYVQLKHEYGAKGVENVLQGTEQALKNAIEDRRCRDGRT